MVKMIKSRGHGFGTAPVFLAAISTILGAILFLRFGYAVGHVGMLGALLIILIGHGITIPTGLAVAEIATNLKVEGGGEYYIISRSFGSTLGGAIGISLYMSQAISIAFYMIAFSEAFRPLFPWFQEMTGFNADIRIVGIPATILLLIVIVFRGAKIGVRVLWIVVAILLVSLVMFFLGKPITDTGSLDLTARTTNPDDFSKVFAIVFPAFTGMTAGVGLSGDLRNPRRSIPLGTLAGTLTGMVVYILVVFKLGMSASPDDMASETFIMSEIAVWGPVIFIGLGAATLSSAIGSVLVAPRTLQAMADDGIFSSVLINRLLGKGRGSANEPFNATLFTSVIALVFVSLGSVDVVAQIISMFFMVTYGSLCAISFLEHFAGNPSYRPTFRSKWYLSLVGAVACLMMMFEMQPFYALIAVGSMLLIYFWLKRTRKEERNISSMVQGVLFQLTRLLQVLIQKKQTSTRITNWRPSFIAISSQSLTRLAPFDLLRWISHYYGFGTFIHYIQGPLTADNNNKAQKTLQRLIEQTQSSKAGIYVDTIISPSFKTAVAQIVQIPGISGLDNNSFLFEFREGDDNSLRDIVEGSSFAAVTGFNICVLRSSDRHFGYNSIIHIWLTHGDYRNANLMILLAYIIIGHPDWKNAEIKLHVAFNQYELEEGVKRLNEMIALGRIPISPSNVQKVPLGANVEFDDIVAEHSESADLVIIGFSLHKMQLDGGEFFKGFSKIKDILFVRAGQNILISEPLETKDSEVLE
jgi:amino acid transporter